ncbi:hypothetical protein BIY24_06585 [Halobacteriovorax marinus]|uniref:Uncharacterized protein n=1 Tax=Halobacteriovorax marinus (strain ATCC BAA-682 / DSM 15412 / SJ) TaxID=862908 RepID=E1WZS1_HALMS|nr:hypothetical protein [Halobacteriovorax marinus]ATH07622.1 hypothetical protein BIY24_06585 [Halobacteriovorax marinus]CBW26257.1 hypothetical protein BMS_1392 [Halobacteriovorax marinus SJ]
MRENSVNKFYTGHINKYFGFIPEFRTSDFDSILEKSISHKWKFIHPSYLSSKEALVLGIKMMNGRGENNFGHEQAHDMFDLALNKFKDSGEGHKLYSLAMGIYYFQNALSINERNKQVKIIRLAKHFIDEAIAENEECLLTRLHLVLVHVALDNMNMAVKELVKLGRELKDRNIYNVLFHIYEKMGHSNIALFYNLKASKTKDRVELRQSLAA